jgi:hypothetical protein
MRAASTGRLFEPVMATFMLIPHSSAPVFSSLPLFEPLGQGLSQRQARRG